MIISNILLSMSMHCNFHVCNFFSSLMSQEVMYYFYPIIINELKCVFEGKEYGGIFVLT